jgi:hypothetical protein
VLVFWFYSDGEVGIYCFPDCFGSWELSLPFVQTEKSMSGYIDLMELLCVVMRLGCLCVVMRFGCLCVVMR